MLRKAIATNTPPEFLKAEKQQLQANDSSLGDEGLLRLWCFSIPRYEESKLRQPE
jgi:hypothetical protein